MNFIKKHKYITALIATLLIASGVTLLLAQQKPEGESISTNTPTNNSTQNNNSDNINNTTSPDSNNNTAENPSDTQAITTLLTTDSSLPTSLSVKSVSLEQEVKDYRLVSVEIYNSKTKVSHVDTVIIKNGEIITGITSALSASKLREKGVPDVIINSYKEMMRDV
ncbi:hypothetical protein B7Z00_00975 [Candidatus Saccharibacteria bacterium 32-50-10]|nr:MAG: hypothetical protein B7Z00_00975 [Candidatus Saccharibacteria bacterium 32-50-10]